jgi:hypothetical protein
MPKKKTIPDPTRLPPIPLTDELRRRFEELSRPMEAEQTCGVCGWGRDVPKVTKRSRLICVVCNVMLGRMSPTERETVLRFGVDRETWAVRRLPYYRAWLSHPQRSTLHLPNQDKLAS